MVTLIFEIITSKVIDGQGYLNVHTKYLSQTLTRWIKKYSSAIKIKKRIRTTIITYI